MGAKIREYRRKIDSTKSMKKIFNAMELIATSRINKARARVQASRPYAQALTQAVSAAATHVTDIRHPLTTEPEAYRRSAVLIFASDRGLAGSYSANIIKTGLELQDLLAADGKEVEYYLVGRKAQNYFDFRNIGYQRLWTGNTDAPPHGMAKEIAQELLGAYLRSYEAGGVDEIYLVFTRFKSMVEQEPTVIRLLPLGVVDDEDQDASLPLYDFEPNAEEILDELLPRYVEWRVFAVMLQAAASELATRQRAMKTAGDNAEDLITKYTRLRNTARQAEVTQELTEIVAGADSLGAS